MASVKLVYCLSEWEESDPQIRERRARGGTLHPGDSTAVNRAVLLQQHQVRFKMFAFFLIPFKNFKGCCHYHCLFLF